MAQLWIEDAVSGTDEPVWVAKPLDGESAVPLSAPADGDGQARRAAALLLHSRTPEGDAWLIMSAAPSGVALNGAPLRLGIRVLADRDEIRVAGLGRAFYSAERLAAVEVFAGADRHLDCPRCKNPVVAGNKVVHCPRCARVFHQDEGLELLCWAYSERCICPQPTAADAGFQWTPHGL